SRPATREALRIGTLLPRDFLHGRPRKRDYTAAPRPSQAPRQQTPWWSSYTWGAPDSSAQPPQSGRRPKEAPPPSSRLVEPPRALALRTLGLPPDADETSIRRAFKKLALELHPDRHATSPEDVRAAKAARFAEASAAYHLLVA